MEYFRIKKHVGIEYVEITNPETKGTNFYFKGKIYDTVKEKDEIFNDIEWYSQQERELIFVYSSREKFVITTSNSRLINPDLQLINIISYKNGLTIIPICKSCDEIMDNCICKF